MKRVILATALVTVAFALPLPAQAQHGSLTRSFVSASGVDTNPCTVTQPCQSFAVAYTKISANGIIAALDPGKYGPLTIIGPVTINGNGWAAVTGPADGIAITVNAGANDTVKLSGLEVDGANTATDGIAFGSGKSLIISNCVIRQFTNGVVLNAAPSTTHLIDSEIEENTGVGVLDAPVGAGTYLSFDHIRFLGNYTGLSINSSNAPQGTSLGQGVSGSDSVASNNVTAFNNSWDSGFMLLDNVRITNNTTGIYDNAGITVLNRSMSHGNKTFFYIVPNSYGVVGSYGNNAIDDLGTSTGNLTTYGIQ